MQAGFLAWRGWGSPRFGKSTATQFIKRMIPKTYPGLPVVIHIARFHTKADEARFFKELLISSGLGVPPGREAVDRLNRLWRSWWACASNVRERRIILIIDEAQKLSAAEYSWLIDLYNLLGQNGVTVTVLLFAQPELVNSRVIFQQSNRGDIIGRFMVTVENFDGICNESELAKVLRCLDDPVVSEYPAGSQCACTRFFVPRAYAAGWRLETQSRPLWSAFERVAADTDEKAISKGVSVGMTWVKAAVQNALQQLMKEDDARMRATDKQWIEAVQRSNFAQSLGVLSALGMQANEVRPQK